ncbi:MAG: hypothetical protein AB7O37_10515 [Vicinamibacteria bacterium]
MLEVVTMREMERIFEITDRLGIHREAIVVPLGPRSPGRVRRLPNGKLEIVVDGQDLDGWLAGLEQALRGLG